MNQVRMRVDSRLPRGVTVMGDTVMINVGERSPKWVTDLADTKAGQLLLCRIIDGILFRGVKVVESKAS